MYTSPIKLVTNQIIMELDNDVVNAVQKVGIEVDKQELIRALKYDRDQYDKGYADGYNANKWIGVDDRMPEIETANIKDGSRRYSESVRVLCACKQKSGKVLVKEGYCRIYPDGNFYWRIPGSIDSVTHWMPLPEAPTQKGC